MKKMGLAAILSSMEEKPHTIEFGGESIDFFPVRLRALLKAQTVVSQMAKAAVSIFDPNADDYTKKTIVKQPININEGLSEIDPESGEPIIDATTGEPIAAPEEMVTVDTTVIDAISPVHAKERIARRQKDVEGAISTLLNEDNIDRVILLIEDSSRGQCDMESLQNIEVPHLIPLLRATLKANFSVFGGLVGKAMSRAETKLGDVLGSDEESAE